MATATFDAGPGLSKEALEDLAHQSLFEELGDEVDYTLGKIVETGKELRPQSLGGELLLGEPTRNRPSVWGDPEAISKAEHRVLTHKREPNGDFIEASYYADEREAKVVLATAAERHRRGPGSYILKVERQIRTDAGWETAEATEDPAPVRTSRRFQVVE